ncbi:MAG: hypothetical protein CMG35_03980 [Candidatus Marinimicrobia bacterium]|nr:hypothetical protein [Candidatus Neomarinimicrobiota bacterium]
MKNINIITPPDKLFNDALQVLLVFPTKETQEQVQSNLLAYVEEDVNIYYYDAEVCAEKDIDWLLTVFKMSDLAIIDIDNVQPYARDLIGYMIAKPKSFWLTKGQNIVYNKLSKNEITDFKFLSKLGGNFETK